MNPWAPYTYLIINILIISVPLACTFMHPVGYHKKLPAVAVSIAVVGGVYIAWDIVVTYWGEWSFNPAYLTGIGLFNLPLEEVLFFITVPYACILIYEGIIRFTRRRSFRLPRSILLAVILILVSVGIVYSDQGYTMKAFLSCAVFLGLMGLLNMSLIEDAQYWLWIVLCYIPFLIFNMWLTALPVVQYNPDAIFGVRFFTIPIEDFFYNFSMLSFYLFVYMVAKRLMLPRD